MQIEISRAAGPASIYRPDAKGNLRLVEIRPAGTLETAREWVDNKRGPKPKGATKPDANRFAESENQWEC